MTWCVSSLAMLGGCETTTSGGAVGGDRKQLLLVSSQELDQMAAQAYAKLKSDSAAQGALNQDRALLARERDRSPPRAADPGLPHRRAGLALGSQCNHQQSSQRVLHARRQDHGLHRPRDTAQAER
jgi:hypothetical protein